MGQIETILCPKNKSVIRRESRSYFKEFWANFTRCFIFDKSWNRWYRGRNGAGKSTLFTNDLRYLTQLSVTLKLTAEWLRVTGLERWF